MEKKLLDNLRAAYLSYLEKNGLTRSEAARKIGVGESTQRSFLEDGKDGPRYPTLRTLSRLAEGMDTTVGELLGETSGDEHPVKEMLLMRSVVAVASKGHFEGDVSITDLAAFITTAYTQRLADPSIGWDGETDRQIEADIRRQRLRDQFDG